MDQQGGKEWGVTITVLGCRQPSNPFHASPGKSDAAFTCVEKGMANRQEGRLTITPE